MILIAPGYKKQIWSWSSRSSKKSCVVGVGRNGERKGRKYGKRGGALLSSVAGPRAKTDHCGFKRDLLSKALL